MQSQIPTVFTSSHSKCQWRLSGVPGILAIPGNMKTVPQISLLGCYQEKNQQTKKLAKAEGSNKIHSLITMPKISRFQLKTIHRTKMQEIFLNEKR